MYLNVPLFRAVDFWLGHPSLMSTPGPNVASYFFRGLIFTKCPQTRVQSNHVPLLVGVKLILTWPWRGVCPVLLSVRSVKQGSGLPSDPVCCTTTVMFWATWTLTQLHLLIWYWRTLCSVWVALTATRRTQFRSDEDLLEMTIDVIYFIYIMI